MTAAERIEWLRMQARRHRAKGHWHMADELSETADTFEQALEDSYVERTGQSAG